LDSERRTMISIPQLTITDAQYVEYMGAISSIVATIGGERMSIPLEEGNLEYDEIMRQVEAGTLTIADAE